ncbi:MAG: outer membrane lipoprotein carrier protein LolA [Acidimicrobiia bacterium]|nr:outer membrane lipoprotein carrier protein LolA [Acidimicrobiia bacterium]
MPRLSARTALVAAGLLTLPGFVAPQGPMGRLGAQSPPAPEALARLLQSRYDQIRDFSADFVHTYQGGVLKTLVTERGAASIKKPGRMRWTYTSPERKEFVSDGERVYTYVPEDKQVIVGPLPSASEAPTGIQFLTGQGDLARDFLVARAESPVPGTWALRLDPRQAQADYAHLVVAVDPTTLQIRGLTTFDHQGGESSFTFTNLKENRGLSDKEFAFRIPRGVDVLTDDGVFP